MKNLVRSALIAVLLLGLACTGETPPADSRKTAPGQDAGQSNEVTKDGFESGNTEKWTAEEGVEGSPSGDGAGDEDSGSDGGEGSGS